MKPYRVWAGYDPAEARAFDVLVKSIRRRATVPVDIYPIRQDWLRSLGLYWRDRDPSASTEFSFTRFLTPCLAGYDGPALFVDTDFVFLADIAELFALYDDTYAVQCVQHNYQPTESLKMGGLVQTQNARKNWTSLMLLNCSHSTIRSNLLPYQVNTRSGKWLHQFEWTYDHCIGSLPKEWNFLVGHTTGVEPKGLHFTNGLPLHGVRDAYSHVWEAESTVINWAENIHSKNREGQ